MDLTGDIAPNEAEDKRSSIKFVDKIYFTDEGLVTDSVEESTLHCLPDVIQVVNGDIKSVLPLIGYERTDIRAHLENDVLKATNEVIESLDKLGQRSPDSLILVHNNRLYGVIIDQNSICRVVGRITSVVPNKNPKNGLNVVLVEETEGFQTTIRSSDLNLRDMVKNGATLSMISINGFAFIENVESTAEDFPDMTLVVNRGYILFDGQTIEWIRLQTGLRINEFALKRTTIAPKECIVSLCSGYVREGNRLKVYGNQNGILDFDAFLLFGRDLQTVGLETGQHYTQEDLSEFSAEASSEFSAEAVACPEFSQQMADLKIESQESDANPESKESLDSEYDLYDNLSPDSFS